MVRRTVVREGDVAYVPLTRSYVARIDAEDMHLVADFNWTAMPIGRTVYARRSIWPSNKSVLLHRAILCAPDGLHVDHISGDALDCRKSNMRLVTQQQNNMNVRARLDASSGFKGVRKHSQCEKFVAEISCGKVRKYLGIFETAQEAYAAYCVASAELHGQYGRTT